MIKLGDRLNGWNHYQIMLVTTRADTMSTQSLLKTFYINQHILVHTRGYIPYAAEMCKDVHAMWLCGGRQMMWRQPNNSVAAAILYGGRQITVLYVAAAR